MDKLNIEKDSELRKVITVLNPITDDFPILRTSLLGGILETIVRNISRKNEDIKKFLEEFELGNYNFNKFERMEIIYFFSLISEDGFTFGTLEKILNVGKSTLKNDMKEVREELHKQGFSFISRPKKGLILVGNENNIRKLLLEYILKYFCIKNFDSIEIRKAAEPVSRAVNNLIKQMKTGDIKLYFNFLACSKPESEQSASGFFMPIFLYFCFDH